MTINLHLPENVILKPCITVFGVGGAGGNAVNNMINSNLQGAKFVVANTDAQALEFSSVEAERRIQLGTSTTRGLGAGAAPEVGQAAAEESMSDILEHLQGSNMVFITAGMGGGTGTGAAPVIARAARELGILTVAVVTKPFNFEGAHRSKIAERGLAELQKYVDTLIVIPNQNLFRIANEKTTFADAFKMADDVLHAGVRSITDLMIMPGLINLDFADVSTIMVKMGKAMMGTGEAEGENRALLAAQAAISNPLLDHCSMKGARGVLINITGGYDMTLFEVDAAAEAIRKEVDEDANIIIGSAFNQDLNGKIRISVVATGIDSPLNNESTAQGSNNTQVKTENRAAVNSSPLKETVTHPPVTSFADKIRANAVTANRAQNTPIYKENDDEVMVSNNQDDVFISPKPAEPRVQPHLSNEFVENSVRQESFYQPSKTAQQRPAHLHEETRPQAEREVRSGMGLFGRMRMRAASQDIDEDDYRRTAPKQEELLVSEDIGADPLSDDLLDIPAYTRRKK
jgi:cell division protein FtsZ